MNIAVPPPPFLPPPPPPFCRMPPPGAPWFTLPPPPHIQDALNQHPAKRPRVDDDLVPEGLWMQRVHGDINLFVNLPIAEWKCPNRQEHIVINITSMIQDLKSIIQEKSGLPTSKQKLQYQVGVQLQMQIIINDFLGDVLERQSFSSLLQYDEQCSN